MRIIPLLQQFTKRVRPLDSTDTTKKLFHAEGSPIQEGYSSTRTYSYSFFSSSHIDIDAMGTGNTKEFQVTVYNRQYHSLGHWKIDLSSCFACCPLAYIRKTTCACFVLYDQCTRNRPTRRESTCQKWPNRIICIYIPVRLLREQLVCPKGAPLTVSPFGCLLYWLVFATPKGWWNERTSGVGIFFVRLKSSQQIYIFPRARTLSTISDLQ